MIRRREAYIGDDAPQRPQPAHGPQEPVLGPVAAHTAPMPGKREPTFQATASPVLGAGAAPSAMRREDGNRFHIDDDDAGDAGDAASENLDDRDDGDDYDHDDDYDERHGRRVHGGVHNEDHQGHPAHPAGHPGHQDYRQRVEPAFAENEPNEEDDFTARRSGSSVRHSLGHVGRSSMARAFWSLCLTAAVVALLLQALWWWRTPIATYVPVLRPLYDTVCASFGCQVGYVREPGKLSIESSSIQPDTPAQPGAAVQGMRLSAVLRNRADHAQPWPAMELVLTDFADAPVMRRTVAPGEYLPTDAPAFFAAGSEREIQISLAVRGVPVSGYRLSLFFP